MPESSTTRSLRRHELKESGLARNLHTRIRHAVGLTQDPLPMCQDPELSYMPVDAVARVVHGDLSTMIIGGLGSLFLQMLHPHAMAGVAQHSRYRSDVRGRLLQTANFIGHTTYGSKSQAHLGIERVRVVHEAVRGVADDGTPYYANDPHLLAWVHACETSMFLAAYQRYGRETLSADELDGYVNEMAHLARDLGAETPPTTLRELGAQLDAFRLELRLSAAGEEARSFVANGFGRGVLQKMAHRLFVRSAYDLIPGWARRQLGVSPASRASAVLVTAASGAMCAFVRRFVPPTQRATRVA